MHDIEKQEYMYGESNSSKMRQFLSNVFTADYR